MITHYAESAKKLTLEQFKRLFESHQPHCFLKGEAKAESLTKEWELVTGKKAPVKKGKNDNTETERTDTED
jgi:hypothetical protein